MFDRGFHDYDLAVPAHVRARTPFDDDLVFGQAKEAMIKEILLEKTVSIFNHTTVEVKCDRWAKKTGNLYFEFQCRGKPSGIATTKSDWYAYDTGLCLLMFRTMKLKEYLRSVYKNPYQPVALGDNKLSLGLLIPARTIMQQALA